MTKSPSSHTPAVDRALDVIDLMAASERDLSLSEIVKRTGIPRQSLIRILNTLCDKGIVERADQRGFYRAGMRLLYLGGRIQDKITLRSVAYAFMQELAAKTHKTIELSTLDRDQLILIEQIEGTEGVRLYSRVGGFYPYLHTLAVGKVYLSHMQPQKRHQVLKKIGLPTVTHHTITDRNVLEKELLEIQKDGYAFEDQELRDGVRRVAAPIYDFRNEVAGCIAIAATLFSFELKDREDLGRVVVEAAGRISERMGKRQ